MSARPPAAGLHVVLVEPEIHWNTGNAGRSCLAAGAQLHLVGPLGFSLDKAEVRRAGLDYWPRVRPVVWESWSELAPQLPALGAPWLLVAGAQQTLWQADLRPASVLIFGCESRGLPEQVRRLYPRRLLALPMRDPLLRSLNLSTSVGIALYEALRQRAPGSSAAP